MQIPVEVKDTIHAVITNPIITDTSRGFWDYVLIIVQIIAIIIPIGLVFLVHYLNGRRENEKREKEKWANLQLFLTYLKNQQLKINVAYEGIHEQGFDAKQMATGLSEVEIITYNTYISLVKPFVDNYKLLAPLETLYSLLKTYEKARLLLNDDDLNNLFFSTIKENLDIAEHFDLKKEADGMYDNRRKDFVAILDIVRFSLNTFILELDKFIKTEGKDGFNNDFDLPRIFT